MQNHHKILFLPRWYPTAHDLQNGVFIQKHAKAAALNNEVVVLFPSPATDKTGIAKATGGNLTEVIIYYKKSSFPVLNMVRYIFLLFSGWRTIRTSGFTPELCHINLLSRPAILAVWLKWTHGIPFMITEHWSGYITGKFKRQSSLKIWFIKYLTRKASIVTAVSEPLKMAMIRCSLRKDIRILPNVVEVLPDSWNQQPVGEKFRYLVVADLKDEIKNISGVIRAFAEVNKQDTKTELVIVGDGIDKQALEKQWMVSAGENPSLQFIGEKSNKDVLKIIPAAHVLIVNSRIETFSVVTLEAIFSGRPVIATRCGGPEQFINFQNGLLIEKNDDKQLAEAMLKIKKDYDQYPPEKVKNSVPNNYNLGAIADVLDNFYNEIIHNFKS